MLSTDGVCLVFYIGFIYVEKQLENTANIIMAKWNEKIKKYSVFLHLFV